MARLDLVDHLMLASVSSTKVLCPKYEDPSEDLGQYQLEQGWVETNRLAVRECEA